jgi:PHD and RING finger domain-containing protein 1
MQYLDKLNRQERVIEEVKLVLKPFYQRRDVTKIEYKEIMRKAVPKVCFVIRFCHSCRNLIGLLGQVCHNKTQEINPAKIKALVEKYIKQVKAERKK